MERDETEAIRYIADAQKCLAEAIADATWKRDRQGAGIWLQAAAGVIGQAEAVLSGEAPDAA